MADLLSHGDTSKLVMIWVRMTPFLIHSHMVKFVRDIRKIWVFFLLRGSDFYLQENLTIWYSRRKQKNLEISEKLEISVINTRTVQT